MLIESSSAVVPVPSPAPLPVVAPAAVGAEIAAHEARSARIDRAIGALDDLARLRRTHELVEAIERLGSGLAGTMDALDEALEDVVQVHHAAPAVWEPISAPLVPITAPVTAPQHAVAFDVSAPAPAATAAPVSQDLVPAAAPATPKRARRQAPEGLAAFVIDFPEIDD